MERGGVTPPTIAFNRVVGVIPPPMTLHCVDPCYHRVHVVNGEKNIISFVLLYQSIGNRIGQFESQTTTPLPSTHVCEENPNGRSLHYDRAIKSCFHSTGYIENAVLFSRYFRHFWCLDFQITQRLLSVLVINVCLVFVYISIIWFPLSLTFPTSWNTSLFSMSLGLV